ncbi:nitrous oxide reductase accessory protein NosL [Campylobacter geochelonis]|uniref:nitrous oxide reductase accessory protein NosL n=1 Tax=Campylobacter geochelonis TaxID=1780362 RepID=UPI0007707E81|nr:nitrous oxide reductase accessory protein NosL [Campylobacter geochelonis]CZE48867.1 NosL protein [Campylobacter geochelonis]
MRYFLAIFLILNLANSFEIKATNSPFLAQSGEKKEFCSFSAKKIANSYKTSHIVSTTSKEIKQYCSLGELATDSQEVDIVFKTIKAVDAKSQELIDANSAFYLVSSNLGLELAFKNEEDAKEFKAKFGGKIVGFDMAFDMAFDEFNKAQKLENIKKQKRLYPMGERIYKALCEKISPLEYKEINELKADIFKKCKDIDERKAQFVTIYLWEEGRLSAKQEQKIEVHDKDRCPVCGMFVYKYPRWAAKIYLKDDSYEVFDGVKDMMKFLHNPAKFGISVKNGEKFFTKALVSDYYTQHPLDAKEAFYVVGSDVLGPMGHELIPFKNEEDARAFKLDHKGTDIVKFSEISPMILCKLDGASCE